MLPSPSPPSSTPAALLGGNSYRNFIEAIHSPATCIVYKDALKHYMSWRKVQDCDQLLEGDARLIQSQLIDYVIYLRQEKKLVSHTINANMAAIRKFYDTNDIDLKWKKIKMYIHGNGNARGKKKKDRPYTHFEISKMLEKADQRARVVILLMCSSGIRIGAFPYIKLRNLEKIERYNLYKLTVYETEEEEYITFCTPECVVMHRLVKSGLSVIPLGGGLAAELFDYFIRPPLAKRQEEFMRRLAVGLERLEKQSVDIETLSNNQKFITIVTHAMVISLRNHQKEKLEALQNAILNAATTDDYDIDLELMFLNYVDMFTPSHLEVLEYLDKNEFNLKGSGHARYITPDIYEALKSVKPKYADISFFNMIIKDLEDRWLIYPKTRKVSEETYLATVTTDMGKGFLKFITFSD